MTQRDILQLLSHHLQLCILSPLPTNTLQTGVEFYDPTIPAPK